MNADLYIGRGIAYMESQNYVLAIQDLTDAINLAPQNARAHLTLGKLLLENTTRLDEGTQHLKKSIELNPSDDEAYKFLGMALLQANRIDEALVAFADAADRDPYDAATRLLIGQTLERVDQHAEAVAWYRQALDLTPQDVFARYLYARSLLKIDRRDEARAELRTAKQHAAQQSDTELVKDLQAEIDALR